MYNGHAVIKKCISHHLDVGNFLHVLLLQGKGENIYFKLTRVYAKLASYKKLYGSDMETIHRIYKFKRRITKISTMPNIWTKYL